MTKEETQTLLELLEKLKNENIKDSANENFNSLII